MAAQQNEKTCLLENNINKVINFKSDYSESPEISYPYHAYLWSATSKNCIAAQKGCNTLNIWKLKSHGCSDVNISIFVIENN
jgi:hypothetical protein